MAYPSILPSSEDVSRHPVLVVGVDGSSGGFDALRTAADLAAATGASLAAVYVARLPVSMFAAATPSAAELTAAVDEAADHAHVECELLLAGRGVPWSFESRMGDPATELLHVADDRDAVCIIVGHRGRRLSRILTGSVTDRLIRDGRRAVLVVPPPQERPAWQGRVTRRR
jgi:nucleotide-binding universal stress UspA family protein